MAPPHHRDPYDTLNIPRTATAEDIKRAYRQKAREWHPDKNPGDVAAAEKFRDVNEAYEILKDKRKRAAFDRGGFFSGSNTSPFSPRDFFGEFFNGTAFGAAAAGASTTTTRSVISFDVQCTLEELFAGTTKKMKIKRAVLSSVDATTRTPETVLNLDIPPGTTTGTKFTFPQAGSEVIPGVYQDIQFVIRELPHKTFKRSGANLFAVCTISLLDALMGGPVTFTHLDGSQLTLQVDSPDLVIFPGFVLTVKEHGMPLSPTRQTFATQQMRGDLHVEFRVMFPKTLSKDTKDQLKQIFSSHGGGDGVNVNARL